ncbi:hypothetical protein [Pandoraea pnomenusa]|uniref:hypothetical protein n=1 Tax=Pandoraea pnomenusa TaxID=93220 RepID=UPI00114713F2|nr:hypothetical protein [Pandoraea pnomenusa]QDH59502.1 hypothetical protein FKQ53_09550 [Pandoraea pnomenusa]
MIALIVTAVFAVGAYWLFGCATWLSDEILRQAASAQASVAVTMLGFMLAMLAILVSIADRRLIRNMNKTGHFTQLLLRLYAASAYFGILMIVALLCLFLQSIALKIGSALSIGLAAGAIVRLLESGRKLWRVLDLLNPRDRAPLE